MSSLYILEINPLSNVSLARMFSHTVGSLFILMIGYLAVQKLFSLMYSHLFIFSFISLALKDIVAKILLQGISEIFLPMFSSRTFMVSQFMLKSFIHFEFILVCGITWWSSLSFLHVPFQFSQHNFLMRLFLLHCMLMPLCQILIDHTDLGLFMGSLLCSIDLCVCSYASTRML